MSGTLEISTPEAIVTITEKPEGRLVEVKAHDPACPVAKRSVTTHYPVELIRDILRVKGPTHLCDEIARDEDPRYVEKAIHAEMFAYFRQSELEGKRILDFGCGSGASTLVLSRLLPRSSIVGIDFMADYLELARLRAAHYGLRNVEFFQSSEEGLPAGLGMFDVVILSAVYEHLLPQERQSVMPMVWGLLKPGGILFLNQTPYRWFPVEVHTTGLPLLNFAPAGVAAWAARRFCGRIAADESWQSMLRRGIRGGSRREVLRRLGSDARLRRPIQGDDIDVWFAQLSPRLRPVKQAARLLLKAVHRTTGAVVTPYMCLAVEKR